MDSQSKTVEARLKSFLGQLGTEYGVLDRIVYKNKNQHRRSSYFQYLLKVRNDLRLLQSTRLEDIVNSSFIVINGNKGTQKLQLLESLKWKKSDGGNYNFLVRLQGAARLLSLMTEPMLKAAIEISTLLARSFFMGFSLISLALLARLRVLVQQILLDVVSVFNMVSSLSQKQHSVKLNQGGLEVFREYHPTNERPVYLELIWKTDKFLLVERVSESESKMEHSEKVEGRSRGTSDIRYQTIETLLGDHELAKVMTNESAEENPDSTEENPCSKGDSVDDCAQKDGVIEVTHGSGVSTLSGKDLPSKDETILNSSQLVNPSEDRSASRSKVAFVAVKRPAPSMVTDLGPNKQIKRSDVDKEDSFFNLLTGGSSKASLL